MSTAWVGRWGSSTPPSSAPRCGASVWGGAAVAGPLTWAAGGTPLPIETRAEQAAHVGWGVVAPLRLVWAAGSPQCFTVNLCELTVLPMQQATY